LSSKSGDPDIIFGNWAALPSQALSNLGIDMGCHFIDPEDDGLLSEGVKK
jgi:diadenosine tetraphosphatase ApaH/serine/threonine PP2A family protein phosphatase